MTEKLKTTLLLVLAAAILGMAACDAAAPSAPPSSSTASESAAVYRRITPEKAKERIDSGDSVIILDVRTPGEFKEEHIPGALLIPNETIVDKPPGELPDLNAEILIYCRTGNRSRQAAEKLIKIGYTKVYDFGGITNWPYETVKD
jgi:rhodanese-related sulfurtransferase